MHNREKARNQKSEIRSYSPLPLACFEFHISNLFLFSGFVFLVSKVWNTCVEAVQTHIGNTRTNAPFMLSPRLLAIRPAHKLAVYPPLRAQVSSAKKRRGAQLSTHIYRLATWFVHILHRPYSNYNYVFK